MYPKKKRAADRAMIEWVRSRRDGVCLYCLVKRERGSGGLDVHHIKSRGSGGGDVPENMITLCRQHHNMAESGAISKDTLREILTSLYGYTY